MEINSAIVVLKMDEYFLRHYIALCISRSTCDLSITLLKQMTCKITNENDRLQTKTIEVAIQLLFLLTKHLKTQL